MVKNDFPRRKSLYTNIFRVTMRRNAIIDNCLELAFCTYCIAIGCQKLLTREPNWHIPPDAGVNTIR